MLFKIKSYLLFLIKSTNQHGVHSPFVYHLVTKCLYDRSKRESYKKIQSILHENTDIGINFNVAKTINRVIPYFDYKDILVIEKQTNTIRQIVSEGNITSVHTSFENDQIFDAVFLDIDCYKKNTNILNSILKKTHNNSLLLINSIRHTPENFELWKHIKEHPKVTVTIDSYSLGFLFFRTEQAKEHFTIRK